MLFRSLGSVSFMSSFLKGRCEIHTVGMTDGFFRRVKNSARSFLILLVCFMVMAPLKVMAENTQYQFDIPPQQADGALAALGQQAGISVLYRHDLVKDYKAKGLYGRYTAADAVVVLLHKLPLTAEFNASGHLLVKANNDLTRGSNMNNKQPKKNILAAVIAFIMSPTVAIAQENTQSVDTLEEVVVTGIRRSLERSLDVKRDSVGVVDAISSEDLGKLPDNNVAEALQRITGVAITRNRGEGQFISVRGLGPEFNAVTLNGRILATENAGREFSFDVLGSELISGAQIHKSPEARMVEGGIGSVTNLSTGRPLDQDGNKASFSLNSNYGDLADEYGSGGSGIFSYSNEEQTFGVLVSTSFSKKDTREDGIDINSWAESAYDADGDGVKELNVIRPTNTRYQTVIEEKERIGGTFAVQWRPSESLEFALDGLYSKFDTESRTLAVGNPWTQFDGQEVTDIQVVDGRISTLSLTNFVPDVVVIPDPRTTDTVALGLNGKWSSDTLTLAADVAYSKAERSDGGQRGFIVARTVVDSATLDLSQGGDLPNISYSRAIDDAGQYGAHYISGTRGINVEDEVVQFQVDGDWTPNDDGTSIKFGSGYTQRTKTNQTVKGNGSGCSFCGVATADEFASKYPGIDPLVTPVGYFLPIAADVFLGLPIDDFGSSLSGDVPSNWLDINLPAYYEYLKSVDAQVPGNLSKSLTDIAVSPANSFEVEESVFHAYIQGDFEGELGDMPYGLNVGVRIAHTNLESTGAGQVVAGVNEDSLGNKEVVLASGVDLRFTNSYTDIMPSLNFRLNLRDDLILRFSAARTVTRPTLTDLSPAVKLSADQFGNNRSASNPALDPYRANQLDLSTEWYFADAGALTAAFFYKDLDTFITPATDIVTLSGVDFISTQPQNGEGATVQGIELAYQQVFDFLPAPFDGFGAQVNYTYADSEATFGTGSNAVTAPLEGLSKDTYNLVVFYEMNGFSARLAYNSRGEFLARREGAQSRKPEFTEAFEQLDASVSYDITENLTVYGEGLNLNDEILYNYQEVRAQAHQVSSWGRTFNVGIRGTF